MQTINAKKCSKLEARQILKNAGGDELAKIWQNVFPEKQKLSKDKDHNDMLRTRVNLMSHRLWPFTVGSQAWLSRHGLSLTGVSWASCLLPYMHWVRTDQECNVSTSDYLLRGETALTQPQIKYSLWSPCWIWISMLFSPFNGRNDTGQTVLIKAQSRTSSCPHLPGGHRWTERLPSPSKL